MVEEGKGLGLRGQTALCTRPPPPVAFRNATLSFCEIRVGTLRVVHVSSTNTIVHLFAPLEHISDARRRTTNVDMIRQNAVKP